MNGISGIMSNQPSFHSTFGSKSRLFGGVPSFLIISIHRIFTFVESDMILCTCSFIGVT